MSIIENAHRAYIAPLIEAQKSPKEMLRVYIKSNFKFVAKTRNQVFAVIEIVPNERSADGKLRFAGDHDDTISLPIESTLAQRMQEGVFQEFTKLSARVMAMTIRNAIDGFTIELKRNAQFDVPEYVNEWLQSLSDQLKSNVKVG